MTVVVLNAHAIYTAAALDRSALKAETGAGAGHTHTEGKIIIERGRHHCNTVRPRSRPDYSTRPRTSSSSNISASRTEPSSRKEWLEEIWAGKAKEDLHEPRMWVAMGCGDRCSALPVDVPSTCSRIAPAVLEVFQRQGPQLLDWFGNDELPPHGEETR